MTKNIFQIAAFILITAITATKPAQAAQGYDGFLQLYDGLLMAHIESTEKDGITYNGINYRDWAKDERHHEAKKLLLRTSPDTLTPQAAKMAYWINVYNFLTIELIIREDEQETIKNLGGFFTSPWKTHSWTLGDGKDYTLDHIEHKILRPMGDERIHFAINCASVSCPDLRIEAYRAEKLGRQLDEQTVTTLDNPAKGMRVEDDKIYVSKIFDWFEEDFKDGDIKSWLGDYKELDHTKSIRFMDYDWSLNKTP